MSRSWVCWEEKSDSSQLLSHSYLSLSSVSCNFELETWKSNFNYFWWIWIVKMATFLENSSKAWTEFRSDLVCQLCQDHVRPRRKQWYRCWNLHPICQDCKGKNEICSCSAKITNEFCKMTEKLLSVVGMKYNCVNTKNGCQEVLAETALESHESECIY